MEPTSDKINDFPVTTEMDLSRTKWLLRCNQEIIGDELERISLLKIQISELESTPAGGFFTPDVRCVPGKWTCLSWKDSDGIDHRVADSSFAKCVVKHLQSQPKKVLGLAAVIAIGLSSTYLAGQAYQRAETNGTIDAIGKSAQQGLYRVLEGALEVRDNFF